MTPRSSTTTLIAALEELAREIHCEDGTANAAILEASQRLSELQEMLREAYPIVKAQHGAEHMLDGFKKRTALPIDALLTQFEREVA